MPFKELKEEFFLDEQQVHVWIFELSSGADRIEYFRSQLAEDEIAHAQKFHFLHLQISYIIGHGVLRCLLAHYLNVPAANIIFRYSEQGKPRLMDPDCPLRFNLSHSGMLGTCALSVDCEIGVDVEQIRAMPDLFDIARQFFSPAECVDLKTAPPEQREAAFFSCWTRKEAYIKAIGGGISIPLDSFRVSLLPGEPVQLLSAPPQHGGPWTIQSFDPAPDYRGAVAYNKSPRQLVVRTTSAEEVFAVCAPRGVTRKR